MREVIIKEGTRTVYFGIVNNPVFEVASMKKKPRKIITFENYITRSGIEYFPKGASYPIKVPSIALKDIMEGLHKYK